jgi:hypothetical protein
MFWINLELITFAGSRLRLAAIRRTLVERRATSVSEAEHARPMSHREIRERLELSVAPPALDAHRDGTVRDFSQPRSCHPLAPLPRCRIPKRIPGSTGTQGNAPRAELADACRLFARLVLHQVRPDHARPQNHSYDDSKPGALSVAVAETGSRFTLGSAKRVTIAQATCPHPLPTPIEALFSELASRRLRKLVMREKP